MYNSEINYLIGIDFGHGETTASILKIKEDLIDELNNCILRELSISEEVNDLEEGTEINSDEKAEQMKNFSELISDIKMDSFGSIVNLPIQGDDKTVKSAMARLYTIEDEDNPESEKSEWIISPSIQDLKELKDEENHDNDKYFEFLAYFKGPIISSNDIARISPQQEKAFRHFVEEMKKQIESSANKMGADISGEKCNCIIYAACPSTWTKKQKDKYLTFLRECGLPCKEVLYESDTAYLSIRNTVNEDGIKDNLLVIDLGSSTIDFTWYGSVVEGTSIRPQDPVRGGNPQFGASQVEEKLFSYMKAHEKTAESAYHKLKKIFPNYADSILQYAIRLKKEEWFKRIKAGKEHAKFGDVQMDEICYEFTHQDKFGPDDDADGRALQYGKDKIEEILKDFLDNLKNEFEKFKNKEGVGDIKYVMLTGSASKMYFVAPLAEKVFGVSKKNKTLIDDPDAEFTVSKGAAKFGLYKYLSDPLSEEIKKMIDRTWGNYDWVNPVVKESIKKVTQQVYKELLYGVIDNWAAKNSDIVSREDHNLNKNLSKICKEIGTNTAPWKQVSQAEPLFKAGCHSIHAVLREIFDYIEMANDKTRDVIDKKVSEALTDEVNKKVGVLFKKYISVYLNDKDYSDCNLPTFYKVTVDINSQMQYDLLKKLIEFTYGQIVFETANSLNKYRKPDGFSVHATRSELCPELKRAINDFVECIDPKYPEKEISEACMKSVEAKLKEIEAICKVEVYRLSDQQ